MADPLRVAAVGCGDHMVSRLLPSIQEASDVVLTAAVDTDPTATRAVAHHGVQTFHDTQSMAASGIADAAVIAVPHDALADTALTCINAGLHVLVEKPLARNRAEAEGVTAAARERGVVAMPGYCLRFHPARTHLRDLLARGLTGELVSIVAFKGGPPLEGWLSEPARGGGQLAFVGSHLVDQVLWLHRARVVSVSARIVNRHDTGSDETSSILMTFDDGVTAALVVSQASPAHGDVIDLVGRSGRLRSDVFAATVEVNATASRTFDRPATLHHFGDAWQAMFDGEIAEFARVVRQRTAPVVTSLDAIRTLAVLDAVREAAESGGSVDVDDPWDGRGARAMARRGPARMRLQLTYPADKIQTPIVNELARRFDLRLDIRRADIDGGIGWVQLLVEGEHDEIDAAVEWTEAQGIRVDPVEGEIVGG